MQCKAYANHRRIQHKTTVLLQIASSFDQEAAAALLARQALFRSEHHFACAFHAKVASSDAFVEHNSSMRVVLLA